METMDNPPGVKLELVENAGYGELMKTKRQVSVKWRCEECRLESSWSWTWVVTSSLLRLCVVLLCHVGV